jgi:fatty acid desaturase
MHALPTELLGTASVPRLILLALADWTAIAAIWIVAPHTPSWTYPLWILLLAGRFHALGVVLHDAIHMPRLRKNLAVRVLEIMAGYPVGSTIEAMRYHHLRHHRDLGMSGDPYLKAWVGKSEIRFWVMSLRYLLLVPLWILRGVYGSIAAYLPNLRNSYGRLFLQDRSGEDLAASAEVIACAREDRWQTLFYGCLGVLVVLCPHWTLTMYVVPLVVGGYFAGYRLLVEHSQEPNEDRSQEATIRSTRNHHLGFLGGLFFAPHNVGYHVVHHLHPQASLENLPKLQNWYDVRKDGNSLAEGYR